MNKPVGKLIGYRKQILNTLKKNNIKYEYSSRACQYYIGEGFYINHREKAAILNRIYGYDKHWAYGGALKYKKFPLSSRIDNKPTELPLYFISFTGIERRYKDFYYTIYKNNIVKTKEGLLIIRLTELDYKVFVDLYILENLKIEKISYFQDIGYLPLSDIIDKAYIDKKTCKVEEKFIFEAGFYGLFAKKLYDYETPWERKKYFDVWEQTGDENIRAAEVPIAIYQTAYLRYEEWQLFKKYMDKVVYMNTDSIYCTEDFFIEEDKGLGYYGKCYDGEYIQFIRRNAYVVLNDNLSIKEIIIGGVPSELNEEYITPEVLEVMRNKEKLKKMTDEELKNSFKVLTYTDDKRKETRLISLNPDFILYTIGRCRSVKYLLR